MSRHLLLLSLSLLIASTAFADSVTIPGNEGSGEAPEVLHFYVDATEMELVDPMEMPRYFPEKASTAEGPLELVTHRLDPRQPIRRVPSSERPAFAPERDLGTREYPCMNPITDTTLYPHRTVVKLIVQWPNGQGSGCSGAYILGNHVVLTAAHCIYNEGRGGWPTSVTVIPGKNGSLEPFGQVSSNAVAATSGWINGGRVSQDFGLVALDRKIDVGTMGLQFNDNEAALNNLAMTVTGYPGYTYSGYEMLDDVSAVDDAHANIALYRGGSEPGNSGSPAWRRSLISGDVIFGVLSSAEVDNQNNPVLCPGWRFVPVLDNRWWNWIQEFAVTEEIPIEAEITASQSVYRGGDTLSVRLVNQTGVEDFLTPYVLAEIGGQFYFLPNFTTIASAFDNEFPAGATTLIEGQLGPVTGSVDVTFHAAVFSNFNFKMLTPDIVSTTISIQP